MCVCRRGESLGDVAGRGKQEGREHISTVRNNQALEPKGLNSFVNNSKGQIPVAAAQQVMRCKERTCPDSAKSRRKRKKGRKERLQKQKINK